MTQARPRKVDIRSKRRVFEGRYAIDELAFDFDRATGKGRIRDARREVFERGDSVAALIHDVKRDVIVLTEQFRVATHEKGPGYILEAMAGSVEPGEDPEACLRREMMEETGYRARQVTPVGRVYVSPGSSSERVFLYHVTVWPDDLIDPEASGVAAEAEDIRRVEVTREAFLERLEAGGFEDAKIVALGYWLKSRPAKGRPRRRVSP